MLWTGCGAYLIQLKKLRDRYKQVKEISENRPADCNDLVFNIVGLIDASEVWRKFIERFAAKCKLISTVGMFKLTALQHHTLYVCLIILKHHTILK